MNMSIRLCRTISLTSLGGINGTTEFVAEYIVIIFTNHFNGNWRCKWFGFANMVVEYPTNCSAINILGRILKEFDVWDK